MVKTQLGMCVYKYNQKVDAGNVCDQSCTQTPHQHSKKSGKCSTTFLYLIKISVQSNWLIWQLSHLYWASLPQTTYLYSSYLYRPPQHTLQFTEAQQDTSKAQLQQNPQQQLAHGMTQCTIFYLPDPPFLFWRGV